MLERLKALIPDIADGSQDALLRALLEGARDAILAYTNRDKVPRGLRSAQVQLALVAYNRQGAEGEQGHSEGGVSRTFVDVPEDISRQLNAYRLLPGVARARRADA